MAGSPPLDPRKNPWKRGDICTLGFEKHGYVLDYTPEYLEVRWMSPDKGVVRIPTERVDDLLRVAHASGMAPDGTHTNLETVNTLESLRHISEGITERMKTVTTDEEREELNRLVRRVNRTDKCEWDKRNEISLWLLLLEPHKVGGLFRLRDRIHRVFCKRHEEIDSSPRVDSLT
jgi:hypothetical protein